MELTVVDRNGWKKLTKFDKAVVRIGSAPANDIQLASSGIAPIHLQVINSPENPGSCKVLVLGPAASFLSAGKESALAAGVQVDVRDGDEILLGEYHLLFSLPLAPRTVLASRQIAASLSLPEAVLRPENPTIAFLKLQNLGAHPNCQCQVSVDGLPPECVRIDPPPILYPGAEEEVRLQFRQSGCVPAAGTHSITVTVTAPASYPGEQVVLQQELLVRPHLQAAIRLADDMPLARLETPPAAPAEESLPTPESAPDAPVAAAFMEPSAEPAAPIAALPAAQEPPAPRVVRNPSETYWDETP